MNILTMKLLRKHVYSIESVAEFGISLNIDNGLNNSQSVCIGSFVRPAIYNIILGNHIILS